MMKSLDKREKKHTIRKKALKAAKGSISIFLCLIIIPFMTIVIELIEYMRYQQAIEVTSELYELAGNSALTDTDAYLLKRFGLLVTSQESDFTDHADLLTQNMNILGNQTALANAYIEGDLTLDDIEILKQQIIEFSELSVPLNILGEDLKLDELIAKLESLSNFQNMLNTANEIANVTDKITTAVNSLKDLSDALSGIQGKIDAVKTQAQTAVNEFKTLYEDIINFDITGTLQLPSKIEDLEDLTTIQDFVTNNALVQQFETAYKSVDQLISKFDTLKTSLSNIVTKAEKFKTDLQAAVDAAGDVGNSASGDKDGNGDNLEKATETAADVVDSILGEIKSVVNDTFNSIIDSAKTVAQETADQMIAEIKNQIGMNNIDIGNRLAMIANGTYFDSDADSTNGYQVSEQAQKDIGELLVEIKAVANTYVNDGVLNVNGMLQMLKGKFIPDFSSLANIGTLASTLETEAEEALKKLQGDAKTKITDMLNALLAIVQSLFKFTVFYDPQLNSNVDLPNAFGSPYDGFIDAVNGITTAIEDFKNASSSGNPFEKLAGMVKAAGTLVKSVGKVFTAIGAVIEDKVKALSNIISGGWSGMYDRFIISGYMRHNLPSRIDAGTPNNQGYLTLNGAGITGFNFDDIPRPKTTNSENAEKIAGLATLSEDMNSILEESGSDSMFRGAELEYIYAGTGSEIGNQVAVFMDMYFFRMLLSLPAIFTDETVSGLAGLCTVAAPVVYIIYALMEPFVDMILLVNGSEDDVCLVKGNCWLSADGLPILAEAIAKVTINNETLRNTFNEKVKGSLESLMSDEGISPTGNFSNNSVGMDYETHMLIMMLAFSTPQTQLKRLKNLIELEADAYYAESGKTFDLSNAYTTVTVSSDVTFNPFINLNGVFLPTITLERTYGY